MAYDVTIWKWKAGVKRKDPDAVLDRIGEDRPHESIDRFDVHSFKEKLIEVFDLKDDDDDPFVIYVIDFTGCPANWVGLSISFSQAGNVMPRLKKLAKQFGLFIADEN